MIRVRFCVRVLAGVALLFVVVGLIGGYWFSAVVDAVVFLILCGVSRALSWALRLREGVKT